MLNTRGPLSAIGVGVPLAISGWAAELWLALLYACSIVAWARVALTFGSRAAILTSALLLVFPGYGILFHQLASDSLFAAGFAIWALLMMRAIQRPSVKAFAFAGLGMGALVLIRPANQVLLVMALLPLVLRAPWRDRLAWLAAFFIPAVALSQAWKAIAELRYGDAVVLNPSTGLLALSALLVPLLLSSPWRGRVAAVMAVLVVAALGIKGLPGQSPAQYTRSVIRNESNQFVYRSFELDRIMAPENGPASRRLARVVERELLPREPYRSYGVDVHEFFASGSDRIFGDLTGVAAPADLAAATREAIRKHPRTFVSSIARTWWEQLANRPVYAPESSGGATAGGASQPNQTDFIVVNGRRLPRPSEGQPIPSSAIGPLLWTPGGSAQEVWTSATEHRFVFSDPRDARRYENLGADVGRLSNRLPTRDGAPSLMHRLNQVSHRFPPLIAFLLIGAISLAWRRPRGALVAVAPAVAGLVVITATALVAPSVAEYAAPVSPAFVLLTAVGLAGAPARGRRTVRLDVLATIRRLRRRRGRSGLGGEALHREVEGLRGRRRRAERPEHLPARGREGVARCLAVRLRSRQDVRVPAVRSLARRAVASTQQLCGRIRVDAALAGNGGPCTVAARAARLALLCPRVRLPLHTELDRPRDDRAAAVARGRSRLALAGPPVPHGAGDRNWQSCSSSSCGRSRSGSQLRAAYAQRPPLSCSHLRSPW